MKGTVLLLVAVLTLGPVVLAQEGPPSPASELVKFKPMIGSWEGSGTATMGPPGTPASPWTSKSTCRWILDGHFIQEEVRVDIQGQEKPLLFKSFYGWDREKKQFVVHGVGNEGLVKSGGAFWIDANTLVSTKSGTQDGLPKMSRTITKFSGDTCSFTIEYMQGANPAQVAVQGTLKRADASYSMSSEEAAIGLQPASDMMKKIHGMVGKYTMKGEMIPAPGAPAMAISSRESCQPLFGGTVLVFHIQGDPTETGYKYESWGFLAHDPEKNCYQEVWVNNMGETGTIDCRWSGEHQLVFTSANTQFGEPGVQRGTLELSETGAIRKASMDRLHKTAKVERAFIGEYTKLKTQKD